MKGKEKYNFDNFSHFNKTVKGKKAKQFERNTIGWLVQNICKVIFIPLPLIIVGVLFISNLAAYSLNPETEKEKRVDQLILKGLDQLHDADYINTLETFSEVIKELPEHPVGYFFYAATIEWLIIDHRNFAYQSVFVDYIEQAIEKAKGMIDKNEKDPWGHFYLGAAYGFRGVFAADYGSIFTAYRDGVRSSKALQKAIELNPKIYDAYYGIGTIEFYKAHYLNKFLGIRDSKGTKEKGIGQVLTSIDRGKYSSVEASITLIRIYYEDNRLEDMSKISKELTDRFPNYLAAYWFLARSYVDSGDTENMILTYRKIRELLNASSFSTAFSFVEVDYSLALYHYERGEYKEAYRYLKGSEKALGKIDDRMKYVRKYKKNAEKLLKKIEKKLTG